VDLPLSADRAVLDAFCARWKVAELSLFGSILRDDFRADSDVDVLVEFEPDARWTLLDLTTMEDELGSIFGRRVDLVSRRGLEASRNYLRRDAILSSARALHGAR
jgi:hypothetical protein